MNRKKPEALEFALSLLKRRGYFEQEMRARLEQKGFTAPEQDAVILRLTELNLLNDQARIDYLVENRSKSHGALYLANQLSPLGEETQDLAEARLSLEEEIEAAKQLLTKRSMKPAKAARYLAARGFRPETIEAVVEFHD